MSPFSIKHLLFLLFFLTNTALKGQSFIEDHKSSSVFAVQILEPPMPEVHTPTQALNNYLNQHPELKKSNMTYSLLSIKKSKRAYHYSFQQHICDVPVFFGILKINTSLQGEVYSIGDNSARNMAIDQEEIALAKSSMDISKLIWLRNNNKLNLYRRSRITKTVDKNIESLSSVSGSEVILRDLNRYLTAKDSSIYVKVFLPDPITSSKSVYGKPIHDRGDSNYSAIEAQQYIMRIPARFENDSFKLENEYIKMNNHSAPNYSPTTLRSDSFFFDRSQYSFEDVNVFFHITRFRAHLDSLGYDHLCKKQILFDSHGLGDVDNSIYSNNFVPERITFGSGGVDDAEDVGPIIHEYGHALSDDASPKSNFGKHREILDEGICDYFTASYSRELSDYEWRKVYKWDGHNEFWDGRTISQNKIYPRDTFGTTHAIGEIISGTLMDLWQAMGRNNTDMLVLESLYELIPNMHIQHYGNSLFQVEKKLFNGKYKNDLCLVLSNRGLIDTASTQNTCPLLMVKEGQEMDNIFIKNTQAFADGSGPLIISASSEFNILVYDLSGHVVYATTEKKRHHELNPLEFKEGLYILTALDMQKSENIKIIRH